VQAEVVIDVVATVLLTVGIPAPAVAPAAEPNPEVNGVGAPNKCLGRDGGWLADLEAHAEIARGPNFGGVRWTWADGKHCRRSQC